MEGCQRVGDPPTKPRATAVTPACWDEIHSYRLGQIGCVEPDREYLGGRGCHDQDHA